MIMFLYFIVDLPALIVSLGSLAWDLRLGGIREIRWGNRLGGPGGIGRGADHYTLFKDIE